MDKTLSPRRRKQQRLSALKTERQSWFTHWQEISDYLKPRRGRFLSNGNASSRSQDGTRRNGKVLNGTPVFSSRVLGAGMQAGITSPARPWFRLTTPDPDLAEFGAVKEWLHKVEEIMRQAYARSNIYKCLHMLYENLADFATAVVLVEEDAEDMLRGYTLPIGSFSLANDDRLRVNTVYRETAMTVEQLIEKFGINRVSEQVKRLHEKCEYDRWIDVVHAIEPRRGAQPGALGSAGKPWASYWFEANAPEDGKAQFLRESGYDEFPAMCPRWEVNGEDVYGSSCPGIIALGDARGLYFLEKKSAAAVDKLVDPPMKGPTSMMRQRASLLPGDITYVDAVTPGQSFQPAMEVQHGAIQVIDSRIDKKEFLIKRAYYADVWVSMLERQGQAPEKTAREIAELHEEKMLQLGPVTEQMQDELLDPLIDRTFAILNRLGHIPPPPEELQGVELRVEYISVMAQAQKLLSTSGIERVAAFVGNLAAVKVEAADKLNVDAMVDEYAASVGVKPSLIRTADEVEAIRKARAEAQAEAAQAAQGQQMLDGAKTLSETEVAGNNALGTLLNSVGGPLASAGSGVRH